MIDTNSLKASLIDLAVSGRLSAEFQAEDSVSEIIEKLPKPSNKRKKLLGQAFEYGKQSAIPENWRWMLLGEISSYGDTPVKASISNVSDNTWILDLEDIKAGGELLTKTRAKEKQFVGEKTIFHSGQVLYSKLRPYLKKVLVADENGISTPELISFDVFGGILPQYIVCCLLDSFTNRAIDKRSYGIKMPRIDAGFMVNLPVPVPPVSEQHYIIERLEAAFSLIDTIENLQIEYTSNQETLKSKLIDAAIQGKLTEQLPEDGTGEELYQQIITAKKELEKEGKIKKSKKLPEISLDEIPFDIPRSWRWIRLGDICSKIVDGDHNPPKGIKQKTEYLMASAININHDRIENLDSVRYLSKDVFDEENKRTNLQINDVLLTIVGTMGRSCVYEGGLNLCFQRSVSVITTLVNSRYIKRVLDTSYIQKFMQDNATGAAQLGFYLKKVEKLIIPLPPIQEQQRIVDAIDSMLIQMNG